MRIRAKKDTNHNIIGSLFKKLGWSWWDTHQLGGGFPDGIAGKPGMNILCEIKDGNKPPSARKLTVDEIDFHKSWRGPLHIVETAEDVLKINSEYLEARKHEILGGHQ